MERGHFSNYIADQYFMLIADLEHSKSIDGWIDDK
jgi:hypothetical protein